MHPDLNVGCRINISGTSYCSFGLQSLNVRKMPDRLPVGGHMITPEKEVALALVRRFHRESSDVLSELCYRHMDERAMTTEENIMSKLHDAIHIAQNQLLYGRDTVYEEGC